MEHQRDFSIPVAIGVDQSLTYTALCAIYDEPDGSIRYGLTRFRTQVVPGQKDHERLASIGEWLMLKLKKTPQAYGQEDYAYGASQVDRSSPGSNDVAKPVVAYSTIVRLGELGGMLKYVAYTAGVRHIYKIGTGQVKKWFTGSGNADKIAMQEAAARQFPEFDFPSDNEVDALAIAEIVYALVKELPGNSVAQQEVLFALRNPEVAKEKKKAANDRSKAKKALGNRALGTQAPSNVRGQGVRRTGGPRRPGGGFNTDGPTPI